MPGYRPSSWDSSWDYIYITTTDPTTGETTTCVFDAIIRYNPVGELVITEHPVQGQTEITDHSFLRPTSLSTEIAVSDAMDSFFPGQFSGIPTKSISAYQVLKKIQTDRMPVTVGTPLDTFANMLLQFVAPEADFTTNHGLRCPVTFKQIPNAIVAGGGVSADPQTTDQTNTGVKAAEVPDPNTNWTEGFSWH